jgi:hypothetical protein
VRESCWPSRHASFHQWGSTDRALLVRGGGGLAVEVCAPRCCSRFGCSVHTGMLYRFRDGVAIKGAGLTILDMRSGTLCARGCVWNAPALLLLLDLSSRQAHEWIISTTGFSNELQSLHLLGTKAIESAVAVLLVAGLAITTR